MLIHLRPTTLDDLDFVLEAENHEDNRIFVTQWTREQHQQAIAHPNTAHLIIELAQTDKAVGYTIIHGLTDIHQCMGIQRIVITQKARGYGKATLKRIQKLAFEEWNAHRLWLDVKDFNSRARHVYESLGFKYEGTLRDCEKTGDRFESLVVLSMLKQEYELGG